VTFDREIDSRERKSERERERERERGDDPREKRYRDEKRGGKKNWFARRRWPNRE
jgi:hypothetical protein